MGCSLMANDKFYQEIMKTMEKFLAKGAKISFDPNIREELLGGRNIHRIVEPIMKNCSVLLPGVDELLLITGETSIEVAVDKIFNNGITAIIVLKQGKKGCTVYSKDGQFSLGVYNVKPADATGAGDSFDAAFLCGLIEKKSLMECGKMASATAALNTAAFGPMEGDITIENIQLMMTSQKISV